MFASLAPHFSHALGDGSRLHLAAHSHHLWADVTEAAQNQAWRDAARLWDDKWIKVFDEVVPAAQAHIARHLGLRDPAAIALAPSTHEFLLRLLSCLPHDRPVRLLTTDGEFHSFRRQTQRLAEDGLVRLDIVPVDPMPSFQARFEAAARTGGHDMVFFSQVFFLTGFAVENLDAIVHAVPDPDTLIAIDGYHGFMARPTDLSGIQDRAFYLSGGYKYAGAGEGACFMACPAGQGARPRDTGWFAAFDSLAGDGGGIAYAANGRRFAGATFVPTPFYRLNAMMDLLDHLGIDPEAVHARARALQLRFVPALDAAGIDGLREADLIVPVSWENRGNFLAYRSPHAPALHAALAQVGIVTDLRGDVLRIGFGLYHHPNEAALMARRVAEGLQ